MADEKNWQRAMDIEENVGQEGPVDRTKLADGGGVV